MNRTLAVVASVAGSAVAVGAASAGHLGYWNSSDDFYVRVSYMVDFDQSRDASLFNPPFVTGLPGAGGMYCVPTASSDLMAYVDRHGHANTPGVDGPGVENWSDAGDVSAYNIATAYIGDMGQDMNTSATGGTNNNNNQIFNAVRNRLPGSLFDVNYYGRTDTWSPKASNIGNWMKQGAIVQFCYGRWNISGLDDLGVRDTGHCVVATKVDKRAFMDYDDDEYVINYADPGSGGGSLFTQSDFAYRAEQVLDSNYFLPNEGVFRKMSRIMIGNDGRHRLIDSALAIFPKSAWGVYPDPNSVTLLAGNFQIGGAGGGGSFTTNTFPMPGPVIGTEMAPDRSFASVLTAGTGGGCELYHIDLASGERTLIATSTDDDPTIVHHRDRTLLLAEDGDGSAPARLRRIEMDTDLPRGEPRLEWTHVLPVPAVMDIAFDDATDSAVLLGDANLDGTVDGVDYVVWHTIGDPAAGIHLDVPQPQNAADPHYEWIVLTAEFDAATGAAPGDVLLADPAQGVVTHFEVGGTAAPALVEVARLDLGGPIDGLSAGDGGRLYVTTGGTVKEFERSGAAYVPVDAGEASPFAGAPMLSGFEISRSRTNFVAELHSGPAWENVDPSLIPPATRTVGDCLADIAQPFEVLDLSDVNAFVVGFMNQDPIADINADGVFDLGDVTAFIEGFTVGCS